MKNNTCAVAIVALNCYLPPLFLADLGFCLAPEGCAVAVAGLPSTVLRVDDRISLSDSYDSSVDERYGNEQLCL